MSLVQAMGTRVLLDLTKNTLGGGAVISSCSQSCASCPSAGSCGAASGYGGFGSDNGVTFTTQTTSGTNIGVNTGIMGATVVRQSDQIAVNHAQQNNNCNAGQEFLPVQDTGVRTLNYSQTKNGPFDLLTGRRSFGHRSQEQPKYKVTSSKSGDVVADVLRDLGLL
ncbi:Hypothetical protein GLP15_3625 [Giardia lamblia P15]|uniref:Uncharacterized protein n=1 Tax=Giardia intestinalis (strain P15) TaxID=658858 RepID=E1F677_GIAIA|nr:Hypothetical protein GLP15_3625 [Giardia lamblia P15]